MTQIASLFQNYCLQATQLLQHVNLDVTLLYCLLLLRIFCPERYKRNELLKNSLQGFWIKSVQFLKQYLETTKSSRINSHLIPPGKSRAANYSTRATADSLFDFSLSALKDQRVPSKGFQEFARFLAATFGTRFSPLINELLT